MDNIHKTKKDWRLLEFFVPIKESVQENNSFIIRGVAINETTTLNNVKYIAEELEKSASTFRNVPILLDHENKVKNIVGRTTENVNWNPTSKRIEFEGKIMDKDIQEMIKDGRIGSVSIGAKVNDLIEEEDGSMKAIGIHGLELSLVAVPGDTRANLAQALQESFSIKTNAHQIIKKEEKSMVEEETKEQEEVSTEAEDKVSEEPKTEAPVEEAKVEEPKEEVAEEKAKVSEMAEMRKQLDEMKEMLLAKKETKESVEDETKGEVSQTDEDDDVKEDVVVERAGTGTFALYKDYSKEGSNLKRLIR